MRCLTASLIIIFSAACAFAGLYVPLSGAFQDESLIIQTLNSSPSGLEMNFSAVGLTADNFTENGENFSRLYWQNSGLEGEIGRPEIPVYRFFLEIPYSAKVAITEKSAGGQEFRLSDLGLSTLLPVQPPLEKIPGAHNAFQIDQTAYSANHYSGKPSVEAEDYFLYRGRQIASVIVRPLDYNPTAGTILIRQNFRLRFDFTGGNPAQTQSNLERLGNPFHNRMIDGLIANPGVFNTDELPNPIVYLVIIPNNPNWIAALQPLLDWKSAKGYEVHLATTDETGTSNTQIRNYIYNAYQNWDNPPAFVLLVGDTPQIPCWTGQGSGNPDTDLPYGDFDNNYWTYEVWISRLSPGNVGHLQNIVAKILQYEQVTWTAPDTWEKHAAFMASNDNYSVSEGTHNWVISTYLDPLGYISDRLYCHTYSATTQQVTNAFNAGRAQGTYSGHGSPLAWADGPIFSQANVQALVNTVYPFIQSYACLTGEFATDECFGETWLREDNGALAFMGSSVTSYWGEDDILEKRLYEGFYDNQTPGDTVNFTWIAGMMEYGKTRLYQHYGNTGTVRRYCEMYNILGDGSCDIWTDVPQLASVTVPPVIYLGWTQVEVQVSGAPGWSLVCAHSTTQPEIWASGYANAAGAVTLTFETAPSLPGDMVFTVTGHDLRPFIASTPITPAAGPYVVFESLTVDDAAGWNPNALADYDEMVYLNVTLQNVGVDPAAAVNAVISTSDEFVTIIDATAVFGNIPASGSVTVDQAFLLHISPEIDDGHIINFCLAAVGSPGSWASYFSLPAHAPVIAVDHIEVDDVAGGNGNMALDPGESAVIGVFLTNDGTSPAQAVEMDLSTLDPYIDLITTAGAYASIDPGAVSSALFSLEVDEACPQEHEAEFAGAYIGSHTLAGNLGFSLIVGSILYMPTGPDAYGYAAYDNFDAPILPEYQWIEIDPNLGGPGQEIVFTSDDQTFNYTLPFTFQYYGQVYTQFSVCSNGWLAMGVTTNNDWSNTGIPNNDGPPAMLASFWEDLSPQIIGNVAQYYDAVQHIYIVEFNGVRQYSPSTALETFQVILYDPAFYATITGDGEIKFQYKRLSDPSSCTVGIEDQTQTIGLQYLYDTAYDLHAAPLDSGRAILFTTGRDAAQMTVTMTPAVTPIVIPAIGGSFNFSITITNTGTAPALYDAWIDVDLPTGSLYEVLLRSGLNLAPGASISRNMTQNVPGSAPAGVYTYWGHAGIHPSAVFAEDSFPFTKSGVDGAFGSLGWNIFGWDNEAITAVLPTEFKLGQNHPNPFNPATSFNIEVPELTQVAVKVYDLLGRQTAVLAEGILSPGVYTLEWDASRNSAGIYFIRMQAGSYTGVIKAVLVK